MNMSIYRRKHDVFGGNVIGAGHYYSILQYYQCIQCISTYYATLVIHRLMNILN